VFVACTGSFVSDDGRVALVRVPIRDPRRSDIGRTMPAWVSGPGATVAHVRTDGTSVAVEVAGGAMTEVVVAVWVFTLLLPGRAARLRDIGEDFADAVASVAGWHRALERVEVWRAQRGRHPSDEIESERGKADKGTAAQEVGAVPGADWRARRAMGVGAIMVVIGAALATGVVWSVVFTPFSPVQQVRAKYFGLTGTISSWDCHGEWYEPSKSPAREILTCDGAFRSTDGVTIGDLQIYQPQTSDVDRPVAAWVVGPHATWAFTSVQWWLLIISIVAAVVSTGACGVLTYAGFRRLVLHGRGRPGDR
jgi:hypothetical protein